MHYATGGGTAIAGTHYTATSGDLYFEPGATTKYVTVTWTDDTMYEGSTSAPYFYVTLSSPLNAQIGTASGYAQITNDDPLPTLSIADTTVAEGDPGGPPVYASFTLSLTNAADFAITANVLLGPGTALTPADYTPLHEPYVVTIAAGQTSGTLLVPITADLVVEPPEEFYATITTANVTTTDWQATCQVTDNDVVIDLDVYKMEIDGPTGVLPDAVKASMGGFAPVNNDDDNYTATVDPYQDGSDKDDPVGEIVGEDDLLPIILRRIQDPSRGGSYHLIVPNFLRLWTNANRTGYVDPENNTFLAAVDHTFYVEGVELASGLISVDWKSEDLATTIIDADRIKITTFWMNGPLNVPGYAKYTYNAYGGMPGDSGWGSVTGGAYDAEYVDPFDGSRTIDVLWGEGKYVGELVYRAQTSYIWKMKVNVVRVHIKEDGPNTIAYHGPPVQENSYVHSIADDAIYAATEVRVTVDEFAGPTVNGSVRGVKFIDVGFIQDVQVVSQSGVYDGFNPVRRVVSSMQGQTFLDSRTDGNNRSTVPWADSQNASNPTFGLPTPVGYAYWISQVDKNYDVASVFRMIDSPITPSTDRSVLTIGGQSHSVTRFDINLGFHTYFAVHTRDRRNSASAIYTQRTAGAWSFNGSGNVQGATTNDFGTWTADQVGVATFGDQLSQIIFDGRRAPITTGTPANDAAAQATWNIVPTP